MLEKRNALPETVQVPDNEKKQVALAVCQEIDEMLHLDNTHYAWSIHDQLGDLFHMDSIIALIIDENLSVVMNKQLQLTETHYQFEKLNVAQLIDIVYARYNDLPLPTFTEPTLIEKFKRCFCFNKQKTRE